jgi:hypothetical protein
MIYQQTPAYGALQQSAVTFNPPEKAQWKEKSLPRET